MASLYASALTAPPNTHLSLFPLPRPTGKVLDFVTLPDSITIVRTSDFNHYVEPPSDPEQIRKDIVMTGFVVVHMSKKVRARRLRVRFVAEATLAFPGRRWEDEVIYERTLEMAGPGEEGLLLDAGQQYFEYTFVLPSTLPGLDRTPYGRVSHRIQATLSGQTPAVSRLGSFFSSLRTRSPSPSGFFSGNTTPTRSSSPTPLDAGPGALRGRSGPVSGPSPVRRPPSARSGSEISPRPSSSAHSFGHATSPGPYDGEPPAFFTDQPSPGLESPSSPALPYLEGDLTTSKEMWVIPLATQDKGALSLDVRRRTFAPGLGMMDWGLASNAVCVGGLANFWCRLEDLDPKATIWSVRLSINQTFAIKSPRRPDEEETVFPPNDIVMYKCGWLPRNQEDRYTLPNNRSGSTARTNKGDPGKDPLWEGELVPRPNADEAPKERLEIRETVRMPDENRLRPSTCPGTITPIRVAHEFSLQVFFSIWGEDAQGGQLSKNGPGQMRKFTTLQDTLIMSCCCTAGILALPTYAESMLASHPPTEAECDLCACGQPLNELAEREIARDFMPDMARPVMQTEEAGQEGEAKALYSPPV